MKNTNQTEAQGGQMAAAKNAAETMAGVGHSQSTVAISYELFKIQPASGDWSDESNWTLLTNINGVRMGAMSMPKDKLMERLHKAHGQTGLMITGLWFGRTESYLVK